MAHCHDTSLFQIDGAFRSDDCDRCTSCNITGHTNRNIHAEFDGICSRYLNLCGTADRSENANILDRTKFQADDGNSFV